MSAPSDKSMERAEEWLRSHGWYVEEDPAEDPEVVSLAALLDAQHVRTANQMLGTLCYGGHGHWDSTMRYGAGCETCKAQRRNREELERIRDGEPS